MPTLKSILFFKAITTAVECSAALPTIATTITPTKTSVTGGGGSRFVAYLPGVTRIRAEPLTTPPVIPMHVRGSHRVMPKGQRYPLPAPVKIRIGRPLEARRGESSRAFTTRVETAVKQLGAGSEDSALTGSWIERWRETQPRRSSSES